MSFYWAPHAEPSTSGCDLQYLLGEALENITFTTDISPNEQLASLEWQIGETYNADFNGDGIDDWIVWLPTLLIDPISFISVDDNYEVAQVNNLYPPDGTNSYFTRTLPDGTLALLHVNLSDTSPYSANLRGRGGGPLCPDNLANPLEYSFPGSLSIYRISGDEFAYIFGTLICEQLSIDDYFDGNFVVGWRYLSESDYLLPTSYQWDTDIQSYIELPFDEPVIEETIYEPVYDADRILNTSIWSFYREREYADILTELDDAIANLDDETVDGLRYLRAMTLEALDRPDEALEDYIYLYESNPDSAWAILANLHLQISE